MFIILLIVMVEISSINKNKNGNGKYLKTMPSPSNKFSVEFGQRHDVHGIISPHIVAYF
jgi:hypothetical protein